MKQNRSLYIVIALLVITNVVSVATTAAAQAMITDLHDGEEMLIRCICQPDTSLSVQQRVDPSMSAEPAQEKELGRSPGWDGSGGIIEKLTGGRWRID